MEKPATSKVAAILGYVTSGLGIVSGIWSSKMEKKELKIEIEKTNERGMAQPAIGDLKRVTTNRKTIGAIVEEAKVAGGDHTTAVDTAIFQTDGERTQYEKTARCLNQDWYMNIIMIVIAIVYISCGVHFLVRTWMGSASIIKFLKPCG